MAVTVNGYPAVFTPGGAAAGGAFSISELPLTEGKNAITVEAKDRAGNIGTSIINVELDTLAPVIQVSSPVQGAFVNTPRISVTGSVTEINPDGLWVNGNPITLTSGSFSVADFQLTEGSNTITIKAKDKAGNESTATVSLTLDTIAPSVTITAPASGLLTKTPQVAVSGTVTETNLTVSINSVAALVSNQIYSVSSYTLTEGRNTLVATAVDRAGNSGQASVSVTLDSTPPAPPVISPLATPSPTPIVIVSGTAEAGSAISIYTATGQAAAVLVGTVTASTQGSFSLANVTLAEGTTTFTAIATDSVGNTSDTSAPVSVQKDTTPPVITVTSPPNNS